MANPEHLAKLKEGVEAWNQWLATHNNPRPELLGARLRGASLRRANLIKANLSIADLCEAKLTSAHLTEADLGEADLAGADLTGANLSGADLHEANLSGANLFEANLNGANLQGADLAGADLHGVSVGSTTFADIDLSGVEGLETIEHLGPSSIGIDTIYKSKGKIPHAFLRGAGVPENFITYMASLVGTGIEFYSLFISYSTHDQEFAERLHNDLQARGVRCWFAPHKLQGGKKVYGQIDEAIRVYDKLLLILSPASMASEWVRSEIAIARKREVEQKREVLFPIGLCPFRTIRKWEYFDSDIGKDSAREIREFHIPDFSNWKDHYAYKLSFDRLLDDLHGKPDSPSV
jgi:uncharacterized protein YjbI with pentapeptide repeats